MLFWNDHTTSDIAWNIAADEALLIACEQNLLGHESALRIWRQRSWAVVMGASGRFMDEVYVDRCQQRGVPIARRSSGGGTVLLGPGTLCVSWVRPLTDFKMADRGVRELQVSMLQELAEQFKAISPGLEVVASGDWSIHGRKCVGSAQRRLKTHAMVHFSLLNQTDLTAISYFLPQPPRMPDYRESRTHSQFLTNFQVDPVDFSTTLANYFSDSVEISEAPLSVKKLADELSKDRFRMAEWTTRF
jgi:lipoate-protein ligase A